jgi:hypothetical protein
MPEWELPNGIGYAPDPEQRMYQPRVLPEPFAPPRVAAAGVSADGTTLERAHAAMVHANKSFKKHLEATNENKHLYTNEGYRDQIAKFTETEAARAVDKAVEQVRARRDQAQAEIEKIRRNLTQPGDAAQESRNSRYWTRTKSVLDTVQPGQLLSAAEDLLASADRAELSVLAEELAPYLKSRGSVVEVINNKTGEKRNLIDDALARTVPDYDKARTQLDKAEAAVLFVETNASFLHRAFASGRPAPVLSDPFKNPYNTNRYDPDKT